MDADTDGKTILCLTNNEEKTTIPSCTQHILGKDYKYFKLLAEMDIDEYLENKQVNEKLEVLLKKVETKIRQVMKLKNHVN